MKYELMYWHAYFVRKGDFATAATAMRILINHKNLFPFAQPRIDFWRHNFATPKTNQNEGFS